MTLRKKIIAHLSDPTNYQSGGIPIPPTKKGRYSREREPKSQEEYKIYLESLNDNELIEEFSRNCDRCAGGWTNSKGIWQ